MSNEPIENRAKLRKFDRWSLLIFGCLTLVVGLAVFGMEAFRFATATRSTDWPTVQGIVVDSYLEESTTWFKFQGWKEVYHAHVDYEYVVDGNTFIGDQVGIDHQMGSTNREFATSIIASYQPGQTVSVYYSPDNPDLAVLEPGAEGGGWVMLFGGGATALVGVFLLVVRRVLTTNRVAKADPFKKPIEQSTEAVGLWQDDGALIIDPRGAVFPRRCIFTNEPINELTEMVLWVVPPREDGLPRKQNVPIMLPLSADWLARRAARRKKVSLLLIVLGSLVGIGASWGATATFRTYYDSGLSALIGGIGGMIALLLLGLGIAERYVIPNNVIRGVERGLQGEIVVKRVDPDFLATLPRWTSASLSQRR